MTNKEQTVTKTTTAWTADELRAQAEALEEQARAAREELRRQAEAAQQRRSAAERAFDEKYIADFDRAALDAEVEQAKASFDEALAANPLTLALADYMTAMWRRRYAVNEMWTVRSRLGHPVGPAFLPEAEVNPLLDLITNSAQSISDERNGRERADLQARREAAGEDAAASA